MRYGSFDHVAMEYVIDNPRTPVRWVNYIGTLAFGGFVDHTGGALLCKGDPALNRITKYITIQPSNSMSGTTLYVRVRRGDTTEVFTPLFAPQCRDLDSWKARVGLGYSTFESRFAGLECSVTVFVPRGKSCELRNIVVKNAGNDDVTVDVIPVVEYTHFDALKQLTNADWVPQTMQAFGVKDSDGNLAVEQYAFMRKDTHINYFTASLPVSSYETDRERFLARGGWGSWASPGALENAELSSQDAYRGNNITALMIHLGTLAGGESRQVTTILGQESTREAARETAARYRDFRAVKSDFDDLVFWFKDKLSRFQTRTPDDALNAMVNVHNQRQCIITKNWSRYLSLYQLGYGARGIGFRDSSQDVMGILHMIPEEGRVLIETLLSMQNADGSANHQFNPLSMVAARGDSEEMEDRPHYYGDDHLWIVLAVCAYIRETGDTAFLDKKINYYSHPDSKTPRESGTVLDHLLRSVNFTKTHTGAHGLPLLGFADWNDTVNLPTGAESIFNACLYGRALRDLEGLFGYLGNASEEARIKADWEAMRKVFLEQTWDGEWFKRYYDHTGKPIGSKENEKGKIYLNAQSWAVISGFATPEYARMALDSARKHLNSKHGIKLSGPGYNGYDPVIGGISTYPPGAKENGGIFLHSNPWVMIAETMTGRPDYAYEYYNQINPAAKNDMIEIYECEPYCYAQNILADEHPQFGLGRNSWLSGTSSWTFQAASQYILGVRPGYTGLEIVPSMPSSWDSYEVTRVFRGATYTIRFTRTNGTKGIICDGKTVSGSVLPLFAPGSVHTVEVAV